MTGEQKSFCALLPSTSYGHVSLGDDTSYKVQGIGDMALPLRTHTCRLTKVLYVPGLTKNLLSVSQLLEHNLQVEFDQLNGEKLCLIKD